MANGHGMVPAVPGAPVPGFVAGGPGPSVGLVPGVAHLQGQAEAGVGGIPGAGTAALQASGVQVQPGLGAVPVAMQALGVQVQEQGKGQGQVLGATASRGPGVTGVAVAAPAAAPAVNAGLPMHAGAGAGAGAGGAAIGSKRAIQALQQGGQGHGLPVPLGVPLV